MDCQICCEKFNKSTRKEIKCPSPECGQSICMACFRRYLMEGGDIEPKCMICNKKMSYMFVREHVPVGWSNKDYLELRTKHLMSREKSLLPESQQDAKDELDRRERQKKFNALQLKINQHYTEIGKLERMQRELSRQPLSTKKVVTRRRCPIEECEGFVEENWTCGLCKTKCCSQCGEEKKENHTCDEETKATFEIIKTDTRPCPECGIPIHKWEGCNQMFCTQCNCMFDYRTGRLETGFFHNPHYFEAIENGTMERRGNGNNRCGEVRAYEMVRHLRLWRRFLPVSLYPQVTKISNLVRLVNHIDDVTLRVRYTNNEERNCRGMRRDFLLKELNEKEWFVKLKAVEKGRERNSEIRQVLELFRDVGRDILMNIQEVLSKINEISYFEYHVGSVYINNEEITPVNYIFNQLKELDRITDYCNDKFIKIETLFKNKAPRIHDSWESASCLRI